MGIEVLNDMVCRMSETSFLAKEVTYADLGLIVVLDSMKNLQEELLHWLEAVKPKMLILLKTQHQNRIQIVRKGTMNQRMTNILDVLTM